MPAQKKTTPQKATTASKTGVKTKPYSRESRNIPTDYSVRENWTFETINGSPAIYMLKNSEDLKAINPDTGQSQPIRYCVDQSSIWVKNQDREVTKGTVAIEDGLLTIPSHDTTQLDFIFVHPDYGRYFTVRDNEAKAREKNKNLRMRNDALNKVFEADMSLLRPIAVVEQLDLHEEEEVLRNALAEVAERNPEKFLDSLNNDFVKIHATILEAKNEDIIDFNSPSEIKWTDNGGRIMVIPEGKDHAITLARKLAAQEMQEVLIRLREELNQ